MTTGATRSAGLEVSAGPVARSDCTAAGYTGPRRTQERRDGGARGSGDYLVR